MVFNLEVDAEHVYAVAGSGLLVHNSCGEIVDVDIRKVQTPPSRPFAVKLNEHGRHDLKQYLENLPEVVLKKNGVLEVQSGVTRIEGAWREAVKADGFGLPALWHLPVKLFRE